MHNLFFYLFTVWAEPTDYRDTNMDQTQLSFQPPRNRNRDRKTGNNIKWF